MGKADPLIIEEVPSTQVDDGDAAPERVSQSSIETQVVARPTAAQPNIDTQKNPPAPVDRSATTIVPDMPEAPPEVANTHLPERIGRYRVLRRLGAGGMAEVFLAERRIDGFHKHVVVKRVLPHLASEQRFRDLLAREARIAARISHPHVVHTFDFDVEGGEAFIVMEYVRGLTLRALSRQAWTNGQPLPLELVVGAIAEAADGLHHVHNLTDDDGQPLGLIHRDISPDNLMLSAEGNCKVLDFGIAKVAGGTALTGTGEVKGKVAFMSPEQVSDGTIDHRTDLYALGISLYYLLTGKKPFGDNDDGGMSNQIMIATAVQRDIPDPPSSINPVVPALVDEIVMDLLEKKPDDRPQSGAEVADRLRAAIPLSQVVTTGFIQQHLEREPVVDVLWGDSGRLLPADVLAAEPKVSTPATSAGQKRRTASAHRTRVTTAAIAAASAFVSGLLVFGLVDGQPAAATPEPTASVMGDPVPAAATPAHGEDEPSPSPTGSVPSDDAAGRSAEPTRAEPENAKPPKNAEPKNAEPKNAEPKRNGEPRINAAPPNKPVSRASKPPPRRATASKVYARGPSQISWRLPSGKEIGTGSTSLSVPPGTGSLLAVDKRTGGSSTVPVSARIDYGDIARATLDVRAFPFAEVWLGNQRLGSTPLDPIALPEGHYRVTLKYKDQKKVERVTLKGGDTTKVKVVFKD